MIAPAITEPLQFSDPGEVPVLDWIEKDKIAADPLYQRPLDFGRVETILKTFSWRSFGALVVVPAGDGYHVTDGQHRLEAAKLHPHVTVVPSIIVTADDIQTEAGIFVDINRNRKNVSALELFFAQLVAGDEDALTIQQVCGRAGVRIPKSPGDYKPNDSIAVTAIGALIAKHGVIRARERLQVLVPAGFTPIKGTHIQAVDLLLTDPEFADHILAEDLTAAITALVGHGRGRRQAVRRNPQGAVVEGLGQRLVSEDTKAPRSGEGGGMMSKRVSDELHRQHQVDPFGTAFAFGGIVMMITVWVIIAICWWTA